MLTRIYEDRAYGPDPVRNCFWDTTVEAAPVDPVAEGDLRCDFAVIGAGFTGLNAALELAEAGADVLIVDAERPGWGASGRNGGFCSDGGSKLGSRALDRNFGVEERRNFRRAQHAAIDQVAGFLDAHAIDADRHSDGETLLAHRPRDAANLVRAAAEYEADYGLKVEVLPKSALPRHGLAGPGFFGALTRPRGFALNPLKYARGLAHVLRGTGARVFADTQVTAMAPVGGSWHLLTPMARIEAKKVIIATNGYSADSLPRWLAGRYLPVQSNILVTQPLTQARLDEQGFTSRQMCYDSRHLLHYFRLLPDNRLLFGARGAVSARAAASQAMQRRMRADLAAMFPAWADVETPYFWSGLVCLARRGVPFAGAFADLPGAFGAFAYHGNGVSMASYCGRLVGELALGRVPLRPAPRFFSAVPPRFPLGRRRRALLRLAYGWYQAIDR